MTPEPIAVLPRSVDEPRPDDAGRRQDRVTPSPAPRHRRLFRPAVLTVLVLGLVAFGVWLGRQDVIDRLLTNDVQPDDDGVVAFDGDGFDAGGLIGADEGIAIEGTSRQFVGVVHPGRSTALTAPFAGRITTLADVAFGATVDEGDHVLTIDSAEARRELKQAEMAAREAETEFLKLENWSSGSEVMQARRELESARREVQRTRQRSERTKVLLDEGIIAAAEYEQELETLQISEASLALATDGLENVLAEGDEERIELARQRFLLAREEFETLEKAIERQRLEAPQSGILLPPPSNDKSTGPGETALTVGRAVQKDEALVIIGDIDTVQIKTLVSDIDIDRLELGQEARVLGSAFGDREVIGAIRSISKYTADFQNAHASMSDMGPPVSRYEVIIGVPVAELGIVDKIRVGMTVDIEIGDHADAAR